MAESRRGSRAGNSREAEQDGTEREQKIKEAEVGGVAEHKESSIRN